MALAIGADRREDLVMSNAPKVHTCPYCELSFSYHNEVKDHILHDHPDHAAAVAGVEVHEMPHD